MAPTTTHMAVAPIMTIIMAVITVVHNTTGRMAGQAAQPLTILQREHMPEGRPGMAPAVVPLLLRHTIRIQVAMQPEPACLLPTVHGDVRL